MDYCPFPQPRDKDEDAEDNLLNSTNLWSTKALFESQGAVASAAAISAARVSRFS